MAFSNEPATVRLRDHAPAEQMQRKFNPITICHMPRSDSLFLRTGLRQLFCEGLRSALSEEYDPPREFGEFLVFASLRTQLG